MNVFEDLVIELKKQNLLEETVIDIAEAVNGDNVSDSQAAIEEEPVVYDDHVSPILASEVSKSKERIESVRFKSPIRPENIRQSVGDRMAALQMVDHIFNGVERDYMRILPNTFDDLPVKKSFHRYDQASCDPESDEYFEAESALLLELEAWSHALTARDKNVPSTCLRRYSETTQPPLSPQALFSLARFYLSAEFSEQVRAKFDFVLTRLFSKFVDADRRELLCPREEIVRHLKQRYSTWSVSSYCPMADDPDVMLLVLTLEDFIVEAESAADFGELASGDFFERLCRFKESTGEMFLTPHVAAAAVECNIRTASRMIDLIMAEAAQIEKGTLLAKYISIDDRVLSEAVGRTFSLEGLLDDGQLVENAEPLRPDLRNEPQSTKAEQTNVRRHKSSTRRRASDLRTSNFFGVNQWMLLATVLVIVLSVSVYLWAEYFAGEVVTNAGVKSVDLEDEYVRQYVKTAKVSGEMLYAVVSPAFDKLSHAEQESFLKKLKDLGAEKGFKRVSLLNLQGRAIGYASDHRIEINSP